MSNFGRSWHDWRVNRDLFAPIALLAVFGVTAFLVAATPDSAVPVVSDEAWPHAAAERTLTEVAAILDADPTRQLETLEPEYPLLIDIEGKEPSGLLWGLASIVVGFLGYVAVGRADNRYGLTLMALAASFALFGLARAFADLAVRVPVPQTLAQLAYGIADIMWVPIGVIIGPLLILKFPNGYLISRRWRLVIWMAAVSAALLFVQLASPRRYDGRAVAPFDSADRETLDSWFEAGINLWMLTLLAAGASLLVRFVSAERSEKQQLKWVTFGVTLAMALLAISDLAQRGGGEATVWGPVAAAGSFVVLPACFLFSVFRYRLYGLDVVISKSLVFGVTAVGVAISYVSVVVWVGLLLDDLTTTLLAMLAAATIIEPIYGKAVSFADRVIYRRPADPESVLRAASTELVRTAVLDDGLRALADGLAEASNAKAVMIWIKGSNEHRLIAPPGVPPVAFDECDHLIPIGEVGLLGVVMSRGDRLRRSERAMASDMAAMAASLVENVDVRRQLSAQVVELDARRSELRASELRLEGLVNGARAAVERDLHDGAQARAVALSASVGLTRATAVADPVQLAEQIDATELAVINFANGVYPSLLQDAGLGAALEDVAFRVPSTVHLSVSVDHVSPDVATAAYFVALEGMVNAMKHAPGATIRVSIRGALHRLDISVEDDGPGIDPDGVRLGGGLDGVRERVAALGGALTIDMNRPSGVAIRATIPMATA